MRIFVYLPVRAVAGFLIRRACARLDGDEAADREAEWLVELDDALDHGDLWIALQSAWGCLSAARHLRRALFVGRASLAETDLITIEIETSNGHRLTVVGTSTQQVAAAVASHIDPEVRTDGKVHVVRAFRGSR